MRMRPALFLAAGALAILALAGCSSGEGTENDTSDVPEQDGLEIGAKAPDFRLKNQDQETVVLSEYKGTKNVVLVFYPADFTPV